MDSLPSQPSQSDLIPKASALDNEWLEVGHIVGAHGLNGDVKIYPDSDFPERFIEPGLRWLRSSPHQTIPKEIQLLKGRCLSRKGLYIVRFAGIDYRDQAETLKGSSLLIKSSHRPTLAPGEYYLSDLIGLEVIDHKSQTSIGSIVSIANAGNDLLEIQPWDGSEKTVLIPFVPALVPVVDLDNKKVEISPPQGLIPDH